MYSSQVTSVVTTASESLFTGTENTEPVMNLTFLAGQQE